MKCNQDIAYRRTDVTRRALAGRSALEGELVAWVADLTRKHDVVVFGSTSVVHALSADAVDEYRLLVIPTVLGAEWATVRH